MHYDVNLRRRRDMIEYRNRLLVQIQSTRLSVIELL